MGRFPPLPSCEPFFIYPLLPACKTTFTKPKFTSQIRVSGKRIRPSYSSAFRLNSQLIIRTMFGYNGCQEKDHANRLMLFFHPFSRTGATSQTLQHVSMRSARTADSSGKNALRFTFIKYVPAPSQSALRFTFLIRVSRHMRASPDPAHVAITFDSLDATWTRL